MLGAMPTKKVGSEWKPTTAKDRMSAVNSAPHRHWEKVYDEVNTFKHNPTGRAAGRTVTMDDAVVACSEVLDLIVRSKATIMRNFPEPQLP
jgi:hypothetical protein